MALFFITYDLRGKRNYKPLYDALERFEAVSILESTWCFNRINIKAKGLREYFTQFIDSDDGLMVSEVSDWSCIRAKGSPNDL